MTQTKISDYALLSDCRSAALVSRTGSVDWLCLPRFDSPSVFARLLDESAGHWSIRPVGDVESSRGYLDGTLCLETRFQTEAGMAVLTDCLAVGADDCGHELGAGAPHALLREIRIESGEVEFEMSFEPRPEYGLVTPHLDASEGSVFVHGGAIVLNLSCPLPVKIDEGRITANFVLKEGETLQLSLEAGQTGDDPPTPWTDEMIAGRIEQTAEAWRSWAEMHQGYEGPYQDLVRRSGLVLQGLTYYPTGAIVAAPTTSLPEVVGGERNWDYRYCWIRDAAFTLEALWVAACPDESEKFFDFLAHAAMSRIHGRDEVQVMFGVEGRHDLYERELDHLSGWRDSRPVRIGNAAWSQRQLDVYGELLGAVYRLRDQMDKFSDVTREFIASLADLAAERWREKDKGIWESRGESKHHVHSKLMCWVALDRATRLADQLGASDRRPGWEAERNAVREEILDKGWNAEIGAFTQAFDDDTLDASSLVIPLVGFLDASDERVRSTVDAIADRLTDSRGLVRRNLAEQGAEEGTFLLCTFWLAQARAAGGDIDGATRTFEAAAGYANDLGLLSEEVDSSTGELIGNFPQAFSHIGLVNAAWRIAEAMRQRDDDQESSESGMSASS